MRGENSGSPLRLAPLAARGRIRRLLRKPSRPAQRLAEQKLDLPVEAAQIIIRPALHGLQHRRIDAEEEWFAFGRQE